MNVRELLVICVTTGVLVNSAGATTSFGAVDTSVTITTQGSGAGRLGQGSGAILALVGGLALMFRAEVAVELLLC